MSHSKKLNWQGLTIFALLFCHHIVPIFAVFKPVKTERRKVVMNHIANNQFEDIKTNKFPKLLKELVNDGNDGTTTRR